MKKKLLLIIALFALLLLPIKIKAAENIEIKSIEIVEQTEEGIEKSKPTFENLKVYFDLNFKNINDSIKYKVVLKNNDEQDYEVEETTKKSGDNYLEYKTTYEGTNNIVKTGEEKTIYITVTYVEEVPIDKFVDGAYHAQNNIKILFNSKEKNPNTLVYGLVAVAGPVLVLSLIILIVSKNKMAKLMSIAITGMLIIPLVGIALEKIEIEIASEITIQPTVKEFVLNYRTDCHMLRSATALPTFAKYESEYEAGMNWEDFANSEFYTEALPEEVEDNFIRYNDFWFEKAGLQECLAKIEEPDEDADYTDEEWEAIWDEFYTQEDACYDEFVSEPELKDPIRPKEDGEYYIIVPYCEENIALG